MWLRVTNDAPAAFPLGSTTVTWTVTDNSGNSATCTQTVTVTDDVPPSITCPADVTTTTNTGCTATGVNLGLPVTNDNCGVANVSNNAPAVFPLGSTVVTWMVTDNAGNSTSCTQTVTVSDNVPPVALCQPVTLVLDGTGSVALAASAVDNGSSDNCGIASMSFCAGQARWNFFADFIGYGAFVADQAAARAQNSAVHRNRHYGHSQ